jgi:hypothetical protein
MLFMMSHDFRTWTQLQTVGRTQSELDRALREGEFVRVWPGRYVEPTVDEDELWRRKLAAFLSRDRIGALASHRSAARLHRLDGNWGDPFDALVHQHSFRHPTAFRTKGVPNEHLTAVRGIRCTTILRTLVELGRVIGLDELELALESALRGPDPKRPAEWNEQLLADLTAFKMPVRVLGATRLRSVLARRPHGVRPTGSGGETRLVQAIRSFGLDQEMERQPTVTIIDHVTGSRMTIYPDGFFPAVALAVETDGIAQHSGLSRRNRDDKRENRATSALRMLRFTGERIYREPWQVGREVSVELQAARIRGLPGNVAWTQIGANHHRYEVKVK